MSKIQVRRVDNSKDYLKEEVLLKANEDLNLAGYVIVDKTFTDKGVLSNKHPHIYPFPACEVKAGEYVCLRTRTGTNYKGKLSDNVTVCHYFYWNLKTCVWNDAETDKAYLYKTELVSSKDAPTEK